MQALALLPLFMDLRGKIVLLSGDGPGLIWKIELMVAAGAQVHVCTEDADQIAALETSGLTAQINLHQRPAQPEDFANAAFAIGDFEDGDAATHFVDQARAAHVLVNLVDRPALSDVQFGAIVNRSPIVAAIATDGKVPSLGRAIRSQIEAMLSPALAQWALAADDWRLKTAHLAGPAKRQFWADYARLALQHADQSPTPDLVAPLLSHAQDRLGELVLIETGTQDKADHITLEALGVLQRCDYLVHEVGVHPGVLDWARREAVCLTPNQITGSGVIAALQGGACVAWLAPQFGSLPNNTPDQIAQVLNHPARSLRHLNAGGAKL